jgi:hypothetical protein
MAAKGNKKGINLELPKSAKEEILWLHVSLQEQSCSAGQHIYFPQQLAFGRCCVRPRGTQLHLYVTSFSVVQHSACNCWAHFASDSGDSFTPTELTWVGWM